MAVATQTHTQHFTSHFVIHSTQQIRVKGAYKDIYTKPSGNVTVYLLKARIYSINWHKHTLNICGDFTSFGPISEELLNSFYIDVKKSNMNSDPCQKLCWKKVMTQCVCEWMEYQNSCDITNINKTKTLSTIELNIFFFVHSMYSRHISAGKCFNVRELTGGEKKTPIASEMNICILFEWRKLKNLIAKTV